MAGNATNDASGRGAVIVTGASRGIGRGIAVELAGYGRSVIINYRSNEAAARDTVELCRAAAERHRVRWSADGGAPSTPAFTAIQADISNAKDRARLVDESFAAAGEIGALVNNAGIAPRVRADITEATPESFDEVINTNLAGPYFLTQGVVRRWLQAGASRPGDLPERQIIFVSSISAETASPSRGEYSVAKAGLAMAARLWAARLANENVQVLEVRPGIMQTDMTAGVKEKYDALIEDGLVPQRRWGTPEDVARICRSIVQGDFAFSTGSVIYTDGGFHLSIL